MRDMSAAEVAWLAGIFDGEGCLFYSARNNSWTLSVSMSDEDVIDRLATTTGSGYVRPRKPREGRKPMFNWRVNLRAEQSVLLTAMYPWLSMRRRARIDEFHAWLVVAGPGRIPGHGTNAKCYRGHDVIRASGEHCLECRRETAGYTGPVTHCPQGHEYTPENTRIGVGDGKRYCRACARARHQAARLADPEADNRRRAERKQRARARSVGGYP